MPADLGALCDDLMAETAVIEDAVEGLTEADWVTPTPADGWTIRDQFTHLAYFDDQARISATDPDEFRRALPTTGAGVGGMVDRITEECRSHDGPSAGAWFHRARQALVEAVRPLDPKVRVPWYGPDMTVASSITARIMETWAHGIDVLDALGRPILPSPRLEHVAFIGARAFANSFVTRGRSVPDVTVRVDLRRPDGTTWSVGPDDATERVSGSMFDFCLLTTQRRHRNDTDLVASGPATEAWLSIAQAFAGPPGTGREQGAGR